MRRFLQAATMNPVFWLCPRHLQGALMASSIAQFIPAGRFYVSHNIFKSNGVVGFEYTHDGGNTGNYAIGTLDRPTRSACSFRHDPALHRLPSVKGILPAS